MNPVLLVVTAAAINGPIDPGPGLHTLDWPVSVLRPFHLDSGFKANAGVTAVTAFTQVVTVPDANWLRLYFGDVVLKAGSSIRVTSRLDGEMQELDAGTLAMWSNSTAYFNGDTVTVELIAGAGTVGNRLTIDELGVPNGVQQEAGGNGQCGICDGVDDRVPSTDLWTGRLFPAGCTASIYNTFSCMVSAGHCIGGNMVVQFKVPNSKSNCNTVSPPIADQFPIINVVFDRNGPGDDWSVLESGVNNLGERAYDRYGELRSISSVVATAGQACELTGYGVDLTCTLNQTQQFADGTICSVFSNAYEFGVDLRGGNSGSSLMSNHQIIGIVTHCPCCNIATRIDNLDFVAARAEVCAFDPPGNDECAGAVPLTATITEFLTFGATTSTPPLPGECDEGGGLAFENDIWFTFTTEFPSATLNLCLDPLTFDARMAVYEDNCGVLTLVGCSDNSCDMGPSVDVEGQCGQTYLIRVGGSGDATGSGKLLAASSGVCAVLCPWDCEPVPEGTVGTNDFLELLAQWSMVDSSCDSDGGGVGINDFLDLLANWGDCP
jgi:hypothetical protein